MEAAVRKVISDMAQGKAIVSPESRAQSKVRIPLGDSPVIGNKSAKHVLAVFIDHTDPLSAQLLDVAQEVAKEHEKDLRIVIKFTPIASHGMSVPTAKALLAANLKGKFAPYESRVRGQRNQIDQHKLLEWADEVGISRDEMNQLMASKKTDDALKQDQDAMASIGGGIPAAFIDGVRLERSEYTKDGITAWLTKL